ncbi:putative FAD-linked oxidoreductase YvdP 1 [Colletotrichum chlorophyti]|uniref:Putative FAD-linked oxidoreductase YvdP 1 n=1 Tax=Colletotrichum chlorophyti TaxID=708187 RepID=A0A1Q8S2J6_9PEZI|nr:putative FAD-linked oxidoreductase YvdP 1 [Colletotrichum chlorophyti]
MDSPLSFRRFAVASLLCLAPAAVSAQAADKAAALQSCLTAAGVRNVISTDATWADETTGFQKRIKVDPAAISFPENRDQVALSLDCARNASTSASPLGAAHSFQAYGFGNPGSLVISMAAFNSVSFDEATNRLTYGGGSHVGPVLKYLWDNHGRHFPHVRGAHVGLAGSSIGGGYGSSSRHLGTPMDNLESVEYMLYNGTIVNATKGSDLFWAAQGAGASYGVLLSVTTNTHKPLFPTAVNFTIAVGNLDSTAGAKSLVAIQDYSLSKDCPDELALRWSLSAPPYSGTGYFYGNPADFDAVIAPLVSALNAINGNTTVVRKTELPFWDMEVAVAGAGMNQPNGGTLGGRSFYTQALTTTTDHPLTEEQAKILFESTTLAFNRTDLRKSGFLDLWGGVSRDIKDTDTGYAHGKNLWLIRWEANSVDVNNYPADGPAYMKSLIKPFEDALVAGGAPLRGFVNYADTELSEAEWSSRLYGANFERLKALKAVYDPEGVFVNHKQAIPLP